MAYQQLNYTPGGPLGFGGENIALFNSGMEALGRGINAFGDLRKQQDWQKFALSEQSPEQFNAFVARNPALMQNALSLQAIKQARVDARERAKADTVFDTLLDPIQMITVGNGEKAKEQLSEVSKLYLESQDPSLQKLGIGLQNMIPSMDEGADKVKVALYRLMTKLNPEKAKTLIDADKTMAETKNVGALAEKTEQEVYQMPMELAQKQQALNQAWEKILVDRQNANTAEANAKVAQDELVFKKEQADLNRQLEKDRLLRESKNLPEVVLKGVQTYSDEADLAHDRAEEARGLADDVNEFIKSKGLQGKAYDAIKAAGGWEDMEQQIRTRLKGFIAKSVIDSLPKGSASDADIELAKSGYINATANAESIQSFLRGIEKIKRYESAQKQAKAVFLQKNRSTATTDSEFDVLGQTVKVGEDFSTFWRRTGTKMYERRESGITDQDEEAFDVFMGATQ